MKQVNYLIASLAVLSMLNLQACYVSKPLETAVHVSFDEVLPVTISKDDKARFVTNYTENDYRKAFLDGMKSSLSYDKVVIDNTNPQFKVSITELQIAEIITSDTVKDDKSKDNGRVFGISKAMLKVSGTVVRLSDQKSATWTADSDKRERITSFQNPSQIITGENKNLDEYRKKDFDKNEFVSLSAQCGQRAGSSVTNTIRRLLK